MKNKAIQRAIDNGYTFSGIYDRNKNEVMEAAKKLRKEGYLVKVLYQPSSNLSRGPGDGGYSAYSKATEKKKLELEKEESERREQKNKDIRNIQNYLTTRTGDELVEMMKKVLKSDMSGLDGQRELLYWAKREGII